MTVIKEQNMFENNRVEAESVKDFLERFYKPDRYHGRGEAYAASLLASHEEYFKRCGYDIISRHDSVTGRVVAYFAAPALPPCGAVLITCDTCDYRDDCEPCDVCGTRHSKANLYLSPPPPPFHYYCGDCMGR